MRELQKSYAYLAGLLNNWIKDLKKWKMDFHASNYGI